MALAQLAEVVCSSAEPERVFTTISEKQNCVFIEQGQVMQGESVITQQVQKLTFSHLNAEQEGQVRALLNKYVTVFAQSDEDLGYTDLIEHEIPLLDDVPIRQRYRRLPPSQYDEVKKHIKHLLELNIIRESCSPYSSPIVVVKKKNGAVRMCVDYWQLNAKTRKDAYPLPRIEESFDALGGACWFTTLDLASGYNQVAVAVKDIPKTAFCTPFGLYENLWLPFGLCNGPSTF